MDLKTEPVSLHVGILARGGAGGRREHGADRGDEPEGEHLGCETQGGSRLLMIKKYK